MTEPPDRELTTEEAAGILNVSTAYLFRLLDRNELPSRGEGAMRRVPLSKVLAYKNRDEVDRRAVLDELTAEAEKHRLGY
jgi:excisionase family DNA binding protein